MSDVKNGKRLTYFSRRTLMDAVERARDEIERLCASDEYDQEGRRPCDLVPDFGTDDEGIQRDVDYTDPLTQAFYVWRYTLGYGYEYFRAYQEILEREIPRKELSVVSVGCGTGIDYWALDYALRCAEDWDRSETRISYVGIDLIDWSAHAFRLLKNDRLAGSRYVYGRDAVEYLCGGEGGDPLSGADVVMFPKSILEIDAESLARLADAMARRTGGWMYAVICPPQDTVGADRIWMSGDEPTNRMVWQPGVEGHVEAFVSRLRRSYDVHPGIPGIPQNETLGALDKLFGVPREIGDRKRRGFHELCPRWDACDQKRSSRFIDCGWECRAMDHSPIGTAKYVCYEVLTLVRMGDEGVAR